MKFNLIFNDNSQFNGNIIPNCDWGSVKNKPIKFLEFTVNNHIYTFSGFKEYNIKHEKMALGLHGISKILIFARGENKSFVLTLDNMKKAIYYNITESGHEYGGIIVSDWREGVTGLSYVQSKNLSTNIIKSIYTC